MYILCSVIMRWYRLKVNRSAAKRNCFSLSLAVIMFVLFCFGRFFVHWQFLKWNFGPTKCPIYLFQCVVRAYQNQDLRLCGGFIKGFIITTPTAVYYYYMSHLLKLHTVCWWVICFHHCQTQWRSVWKTRSKLSIDRQWKRGGGEQIVTWSISEK